MGRRSGVSSSGFPHPTRAREGVPQSPELRGEGRRGDSRCSRPRPAGLGTVGGGRRRGLRGGAGSGRARPSPSALRSVAPRSPRGSAPQHRDRSAPGSPGEFLRGTPCAAPRLRNALPCRGAQRRAPAGGKRCRRSPGFHLGKIQAGGKPAARARLGVPLRLRGGSAGQRRGTWVCTLPAVGRRSACCPRCLSRFPATGRSRERRGPEITALFAPASVSFCAL